MAEFKASTAEEAIKEGLEEMGLTREQAVIEILDNGGFLKKAKVSIEAKPSECDTVLNFVKKISAFLDADCEFSASESEDRITVLISGEEAGKLIGYRGDVLDAIQYIASVILNKEHKDYKRVTIDCENYREKREEILKKLAVRLADKAVRTARKVKLEPMNPAERRVIHATLQSNEEVETVSVGNEPNRYLTIIPKNMKRERKGGAGGARREFNRDRPRREGETGERREFNGERREFRGERRDFNRDGNRENREGGFNRENRDGNREGGFNRENRDGNREGGYNRENRDGRNFNRDGQRRDGDRRDDRGSRSPAPKKSFLGFGSYLGNTKSSLEREILEERKQAFKDNKYVEPVDEPVETEVPAADTHTEE